MDDDDAAKEFDDGASDESLDEVEELNPEKDDPEEIGFMVLEEKRCAIDIPMPLQSRRRSTNIMTKYEFARLIGVRENMLNQMAPPMVDITGFTNNVDIARREILEKKVPLIVRRYLPNGIIEDWNVADMDLCCVI